MEPCSIEAFRLVSSFKNPSKKLETDPQDLRHPAPRRAARRVPQTQLPPPPRSSCFSYGLSVGLAGWPCSASVIAERGLRVLAKAMAQARLTVPVDEYPALEGLSIREQKRMASEAKVKRYRHLTKDELIERLRRCV